MFFPYSEIMRIAYIAAGAAGMYCGSCLHDNLLAKTLRSRGEDVVLIPTYTPLRTDAENVSHDRLFFGGINVYLQQKSAFFRHTPWWFDRLLDRPKLIERLSSRAGAVDASKLGGLTLSMLLGREGKQRKELEKLVSWLKNDFQPDVVHLSNLLLSGMAATLKERLRCPVVCSLSGEDIFLEKLPQPWRDKAYAQIQQNAEHIDAFVALSRYYADEVIKKLNLPPEKVHVIPHGLDIEGHLKRKQPPTGQPKRIGFLARICYDKGLHLLVEACEKLVAENRQFELHVAGYLGASDRDYFNQILARVENGPLSKQFFYHGEPDRNEKMEFLHSLDLFSTPTIYRESKGLPALEALASGVPVVLPNVGSFPEIVAKTDGGILHQYGDSGDLALKLLQLLDDTTLAERLGNCGFSAIRKEYTAEIMADATALLYRSLTTL